MKNYLSILLIFSIGIFLYSCQDKDDDCIYLDKRMCDPNFVLPEIAEGIVELESPITNYDRKIFLEDYTGFRCTNCVPASVTAVNLKAANPDRLSIAGVHCTSTFAAPLTSDTTQPFHKDFRTVEGEAFVTYYNFSALPTGTINRLGSQGNKYLPYAEWTDRVNALLSENNPEVYIRIVNVEIDEEDQR